MPNDLRKARELFLHAVGKLPPKQWERYGAEACGGDADLEQQLRSLLQVHLEAGSFLAAPAVGPFTLDGTGATLDQQALTRLGTQIGPYKLLQVIGEGGMGVVYMAEQTQPVQRKVALKVIKPGMDSGQVIARFEAERQALAMMDHVNIARVLDAGTTQQGRPYFVMELVHGVSITRYCDDNRLTPRQRLELFVPVCSAIQHAHQKGIIHRDIKPSNVMVTLYDGKPVAKVIDFGVAKATEQKLTERTLFTQYGMMVGTLEYMSPEQAEMSALGVDTRSDIYSLGVLLYELLTGGTPLSGPRMKDAAYAEILRMIKEEEPPKPSTRLSDTGLALASISAKRHMEPAELAQSLRGELDWIVMKTLEKDRNRRYATANGFAADVLRYLNDEPVLACPTSVTYRVRKFARRNRGVLATAAILAFTLMLGTVVSISQAIRATVAVRLAQTRLKNETEARSATHEQLLLTQEAEEKATRQLYDARLAQGKAGSLSRRAGQRFESLAAVEVATQIARDLQLPAEHFLNLRNAAIACLALPDIRLTKQWLHGPDGLNSYDCDDKMETYAEVNSQGAVGVYRMADDEEIARLPTTIIAIWIIMSRDGRFLAIWSAAEMQVWKLNGPKVSEVLKFSGNGFYPDFSPDSRLFAVGHRDTPVKVFDLANGMLLQELSGGPCSSSLAFRPKFRQIAVCRKTLIDIHDLETGEVIASHQFQPYTPNNCIWHPDGTTLAVACNDLRIHLLDMTKGTKRTLPDVLSNGGIEICYSQTGNLLACSSWEGKTRLWDARTGQQLLSQTMPRVGHIRFSPDDRHLAVHINGGNLGLWEIAAGREYRTMAIKAESTKIPFFYPSIHREGRLLAVGLYGGVGLWDLASGSELHFISLPGINFTMFEPSGSLLTNCPAGLFRWAVKTDPLQVGSLKLGPPEKLPMPGSIYDLASSEDGSVIASAQSSGGFVLHANRPNQPLRLAPHVDSRYIAVSPDGKLVATGSHGLKSVIIWEAETGKLAKSLPGIGWRINFSPDGKWIGTVADGYHLWEVGSWREGPKIGGGEGAEFSPDGKMLAVESGLGAIRLVDPSTGLEFARLEDPNQDRAGRISFSPDGTKLIATSGDSQSIHLWDLRLIREQLSKMGLDWDLPTYAPSKPDRLPTLSIEVDVGKLGEMIEAYDLYRQAFSFNRLGEWEKAITAYTQAIAQDPQRGKSYNALAWLLATCPDTALRDPTRAVALVQKAVELEPHAAYAWNTLGVVDYRAGNYRSSIAALEKAEQLSPEEYFGINALFLAMAHWQLDEKGPARTWYDQAIAWMESHAEVDEETTRFRDEASELINENP